MLAYRARACIRASSAMIQSQRRGLSGLREELVADHDLFTTWRQDFHMHPELGYEEVRTSGLVAERLRAFGVDHIETGIATTGLMATINGRRAAPEAAAAAAAGTVRSVGLRADMDCLPMYEENDVPHKSTVEGRFHGCGHDGHTTMLLAAAKYLCATRNFAGQVHLIFQPAEEGGFGGRAMVEAGMFDRFDCDEVYGMHNWPELEAGEFGVLNGPLMASADEFSVTLEGRGGHAALPHLCVDPVVMGAQLVSMLQTVVSRTVDPLDAGVVSVTQFHAGTAHNVIPEIATIGGTVRAFKEETRTHMESEITRISNLVADAMNGSASVVYNRGYPATVNHKLQADLAAEAAVAVVGEAKVHRDISPTMGAEDFSYMLLERPGCYVFLGGAGGPSSCMVHNPKYDFNDSILPVGASWFAEVVESRMPLN